ncbi:MAG TPA: CDP-alcohol phosphatidyltransferase family protein [Hyphomonadaceae bacterium]|nr:CDP-alcohol phosphatidyltransferase family protein [Hyphomonadaceae bacterium]
MLKHIPNALTLLRLILAPVIAWAVWQANAALDAGNQDWAMWAAILFIIAALTDLFDGMAARAFDAHSKFGRLIDPIADKALVGLPLIAISIVAARAEWPLWWLIALSTAVIVVRDTTMTLIRFAAKDGEGVRVSQLAKWKTAIELVAVAIAILLMAAPAFMRIAGLGDGYVVSDAIKLGWVGFLALAAALSAYTAWQYLAPVKKPAS